MRKNLLVFLLICSMLSAFVIGCGGDDDDDDNPSGPNVSPIAELVGSWHLIAAKTVGSTAVIPTASDVTVVEIAQGQGNYTYTFVADGMNETGIATRETRENVDYLFLTDASGTAAQFVINSVNTNTLKLTVTGTDQVSQNWVMVRGTGIFGIVNDITTNAPLVNVAASLSTFNEEIATTTTDEFGFYSFTNVSASTIYIVDVEFAGYHPDMATGMTNAENLTFMHVQMTSETAVETGTISGMVRDASTSMAPSVAVTVSTDEGTSVTSTDGTYILQNASVGTRTITAVADGYETYTGTAMVTAGGTVAHNINLTAESTGPAVLRKIQLSWRTTSTSDFDLKMYTPVIGGERHTISYSNRGSLTAIPYLAHQGDSRNGSEPEIISVGALYSGTYTVYVKSYSGTTFSDEGANISFIDENNGMIESVLSSNATGSGLYWIVAEVTTSGVSVVNELRTSAPGEDTPPPTPEFGDITCRWMPYTGDLDLHIITPSIGGTVYDVYGGSDGNFYSAPYLEHQGDIREGPGPEEINANRYVDGIYKIYVKSYLSGGDDYSNAMPQIVIYDENGGEVERISCILPSGSGIYWHVANLNTYTNTVTRVNTLSDSAPTSAPSVAGPFPAKEALSSK